MGKTLYTEVSKSKNLEGVNESDEKLVLGYTDSGSGKKLQYTSTSDGKTEDYPESEFTPEGIRDSLEKTFENPTESQIMEAEVSPVLAEYYMILTNENVHMHIDDGTQYKSVQLHKGTIIQKADKELCIKHPSWADSYADCVKGEITGISTAVDTPGAYGYGKDAIAKISPADAAFVMSAAKRFPIEDDVDGGENMRNYDMMQSVYTKVIDRCTEFPHGIDPIKDCEVTKHPSNNQKKISAVMSQFDDSTQGQKTEDLSDDFGS